MLDLQHLNLTLKEHQNQHIDQLVLHHLILLSLDKINILKIR